MLIKYYKYYWFNPFTVKLKKNVRMKKMAFSIISPLLNVVLYWFWVMRLQFSLKKNSSLCEVYLSSLSSTCCYSWLDQCHWDQIIDCISFLHIVPGFNFSDDCCREKNEDGHLEKNNWDNKILDENVFKYIFLKTNNLGEISYCQHFAEKYYRYLTLKKIMFYYKSGYYRQYMNCV